MRFLKRMRLEACFIENSDFIGSNVGTSQCTDVLAIKF